MLGVSEVTYTYATITCEHPGCNNRINLQPGPVGDDRERRELKALRNLAVRQGWSFQNYDLDTECPYHSRKEAE